MLNPSQREKAGWLPFLFNMKAFNTSLNTDNIGATKPLRAGAIRFGKEG